MSRKQAPLGQRIEAVKLATSLSSTVSRVCWSRWSWGRAVAGLLSSFQRFRRSAARGGGVIGRGSACNMPGHGSSQRLKFGRSSTRLPLGEGSGEAAWLKDGCWSRTRTGAQRSFWEAMASEASHGEGQSIDESAQVGDTLLRTPSPLPLSLMVVLVVVAPGAGCWILTTPSKSDSTHSLGPFHSLRCSAQADLWE
jgi:hypothetical protein